MGCLDGPLLSVRAYFHGFPRGAAGGTALATLEPATLPEGRNSGGHRLAALPARAHVRAQTQSLVQVIDYTGFTAGEPIRRPRGHMGIAAVFTIEIARTP